MERGENKMRGKKVMVVVLCALLIFGALTFASVSLGQQKALADEATFYSTDSDGWLEGWSDAYNTVHDAVNAFNWNDGENELIIGQWYDVLSIYHIFRSAVFFDTSSLPDSAVITSATLSLFGAISVPTTEFDITVVDGSLLNDPLVLGDYGDLLNQTTSGGVFNTSGFALDYNDIPLNATGMGWISKTGMTKFGLRSSRDIDVIPPSDVGFEFVIVFSNEEAQPGDRQPKLVVTYDLYEPTSVPTLSQWGMIGMGILLAAALVWSVRKRWVVRTDKS
jgi:hypothetical protein